VAAIVEYIMEISVIEGKTDIREEVDTLLEDIATNNVGTIMCWEYFCDGSLDGSPSEVE
jgi:hypothetical protein